MSDARTTQVVLLRGVNVGAANRIAMADLRAALRAAGFGRVRTYLQSGNVLADGEPDGLVAAIRARIDVACVIRSADGLRAVIAGNPFPHEASENPKTLQVTFRAEAADSELSTRLEARCAEGERLAVRGREIYSWHPHGIARSKLALALTPSGAAATARNWSTVLALAELAGA